VRPVATDVGWSVGLLVTTVSCAKMAEPINMPFGVWTHRAKKLYIRWGPRSPQGRGSLNIWHAVVILKFIWKVAAAFRGLYCNSLL